MRKHAFHQIIKSTVTAFIHVSKVQASEYILHTAIGLLCKYWEYVQHLTELC